jgi:biopolymer transport protein ExbD/biopolymer transport protein TolR
MRRFSQRSALVTLSEINITPLLDLAFVLLIIFVITTPLLDKGIPVTLPEGGQPDQAKLRKEDIATVTISSDGKYYLKAQTQPMKLDQLIQNLVADHRANPVLVINIRPDENGRTKELVALIDGCQRNGLTRYSLRTSPQERR